MNASTNQRSNVLGVGISPLNVPRAADLVAEAADEPRFSGFVTVTGVHGVMESQREPELRKIHNRSFLSTPDGMPMVWLARFNGFQEVSRVYGPDLMLEVCRRSEASGHSHYLFGGADVENHDKCTEKSLKSVQWGEACSFGRQILPGDHNMDGFFYACLQK